MKKLIKCLIYPIVTEIFNELLHKQAHSSTLYRIKDGKAEIIENNFIEKILNK